MATSTNFTLKQLYFTFSGRSNRDQFWFLHALPAAAMLTTLFMLNEDIALVESAQIGGLFTLLHFVVYAAVIWMGLAIQIKRYHDKNDTGWWVFINIIPGLGAIWAMIENGMMKGDADDNRFGSPPADDRRQIAAAGLAVSVVGAALIYWIVQVGCTLENLSLAYGWWE